MLRHTLPATVGFSLWLLFALPANAQVAVTETWDDFAIVSSTMGANPGRLCAGADRGDLGCPTYAPSLTTAGDVSVTGNLSASKFIGDGSALTGLSTTSDRITSGTSSIIVSNSGHISFRTAGTERMVINSAGNVGIGTSTPTVPLEISSSGINHIRLNNPTSDSSTSIFFAESGSNAMGLRYDGAANAFYIKDEIGSRNIVTIQRVIVGGKVGIGTTSPGQTLDVSGTARIVSRTMIGGTATPSATLQVSGSLLLAGSDSTTCDDGHIGILRRNPTTGRLQVCK